MKSVLNHCFSELKDFVGMTIAAILVITALLVTFLASVAPVFLPLLLVLYLVTHW